MYGHVGICISIYALNKVEVPHTVLCTSNVNAAPHAILPYTRIYSATPMLMSGRSMCLLAYASVHTHTLPTKHTHTHTNTYTTLTHAYTRSTLRLSKAICVESFVCFYSQLIHNTLYMYYIKIMRPIRTVICMLLSIHMCLHESDGLHIHTYIYSFIVLFYTYMLFFAYYNNNIHVYIYSL